MRLLSVDFDFFFPTSGQDTHPQLWDWGHRESPFFIEGLWPTRAAHFLEAGEPLPGIHPEAGEFWDRMKIAKNAKVFISESHADAVDPRVVKDVDSVWSYDAHHDLGYSRESFTKVIATGQIDCSSWLGVYKKFYGIKRVKVIYPRWKTDAFEQETTPEVEAERIFDDGQPAGPFGKVFICRSGAWVPSWCDDEWQRFIDTCPSDNKVILRPANHRTFDTAEVERLRQQYRDFRNQAMEQLKENTKEGS